MPLRPPDDYQQDDFDDSSSYEVELTGLLAEAKSTNIRLNALESKLRDPAIQERCKALVELTQQALAYIVNEYSQHRTITLVSGKSAAVSHVLLQGVERRTPANSPLAQTLRNRVELDDRANRLGYKSFSTPIENILKYEPLAQAIGKDDLSNLHFLFVDDFANLGVKANLVPRRFSKLGVEVSMYFFTVSDASARSGPETGFYYPVVGGEIQEIIALLAKETSALIGTPKIEFQSNVPKGREKEAQRAADELNAQRARIGSILAQFARIVA